MRTSPLVTVLIDTYNYGQYIEEAVCSVLEQDFAAEQREILVVDDGSTDDTAKRLHQFGAAIRYLHKPNGGQASAFNFGLARARGKIVALLDADDYWLPDKIQRVVEAFERHRDAGMVYHAFRQLNSRDGAFQEGGLPLLSGFLPSNTKALLSYVLYPTSFLAFRRSALELILPIPEALTIQADAHLSGLIVFVAPIVALRECLAVYRVHGANLFSDRAEGSGQRHESRMRTRRALVSGMKHWMSERDYDLRRPDLHAYFKQWDLSQEKEEFTVAPPGRVRISRHLLEYARYYGPQLTWRHRTVTYMNAAGSLVVGYKNVHRLDEWRMAIKGALRDRTKPMQR
jgi:glycosyltransferase involved in cell wall biosynthesis